MLDKSGRVPTVLWIVPPTRMDQRQLTEEGYYSIFGQAGARTEVPGCSLCMGNQARTADGATVVATATRNFPNRMGKDANVFLGSAEVSAITAKLGRLPTVQEYRDAMRSVEPMAEDVYRYLNFHQIAEYQETAKKVIPIAVGQ